MPSMSIDPSALPEAITAFLAEPHLATLTTLRVDGTPHVVPVGFGWDPAERLVRIITRSPSQKVANLRATEGARAVVCQVDGGRWLSLEGEAVVTDDPVRVASAVAGYAARYRMPEDRADRVAIEIMVDRVLGRA